MDEPGFRRDTRIRKLVFEPGTEYEGLVIRARGVSVQEWVDITHADLIPLFIDRLVEWNWLDEDDNPVPTTEEGVGSLDASDIRSLASFWFEECSVRKAPFQLRKTGPADLVVAATSNGSTEMPMEPLNSDELES